MQQAKETVQDVKNTFHSGAPGTTGREVFEDNTATGPGTTHSGASSGAPAQNVSYPSGGDSALGGNTGSGLSGASTGIGGHHSSHAGEGIAAAAAGGATATGAHHGHHDHHSHSHGHHSHTAGSEPAVGATGTTLRTGQEDAVAPRGSDEVGSGHSSGGLTGGSGRATTDKTGSLQQDAHLYERTGADGPLTSGAAGTDRFDTDKPRSGTAGNTTGTTQDIPTGEAGSSPKKSGGLMGALATSDHDFTNNRSRIAKDGAYADTHGHFKTNTDGPGGSALTGREGNSELNPVAQHQSRTDGTGEKKGIVEKIKDALT